VSLTVSAPSLTNLAVRPDAHTSAGVIESSLAALRTHLGMDVAFVGRFVDGRRRFEYVDTDPSSCPVRVGASDPLEETYCARVVGGRLPELIPDATEEPSVAGLPVTEALRVGAYLSVPLRRASGEVMGTLCCFSHEPDPSLRDRDVQLVRMFSDLVGTHLEALLDEEDRIEEARTRIRAVIDSGGPTMAMQPIVDLVTQRVVGYEALARFVGSPEWNPGQWFAEASRVGLATDLERSAVAASLRVLPRLPGGTTMAVNVSAATLFDPGVMDMLAGEHARRLVVELTEHEKVESYDAIDGALARLRAAGARVAVDDAGSGYAGLEHILQLQPEVLKLDRTLVNGVAMHAGRRAMVEAMVGFAGKMDAMVVAEGVESSDDLEVLRRIGVHLGQGYHLGRASLEFTQQLLA
jgi:EAL domain-containing protein (putative c-di-GMP-specific phosphodiesterase class I)